MAEQNDISFSGGEAFLFLKELGVKIGSSKVYADIQKGKLPCQADKRVCKSDLLAYAEKLKAPQSCLPSEIEQIRQSQSLLAELLHYLLPHIVNSPGLDTKLENWLDKTSVITNDRTMKTVCNAVKEAKAANKNKIQASSGLKIPHIKIKGVPTQRQSNVCTILDTDSILFDHIEAMDFSANFCFTGLFAFGSREQCEDSVRQLGGSVKTRPVQSGKNYLIVGTASNPQWKTVHAGTKIHDSVCHKQAGCDTWIISEDDWVNFLLKEQRTNAYGGMEIKN